VDGVAIATRHVGRSVSSAQWTSPGVVADIKMLFRRRKL